MNITLNTINTKENAIFIKPFCKVVYDQTYINRESSREYGVGRAVTT